MAGPSCMSNKQMGEYLNNLRASRVSRPNGSRPLLSMRSRSSLTTQASAADSPIRPVDPADEIEQQTSFSKRSRRLSHRPSVGSSFVDQPTMDEPEHPEYKEHELRRREKAEARAVRLALEEIDMVKEQRIYNAAQKEANELIWKHENSDAPYRPDETSQQEASSGESNKAELPSPESVEQEMVVENPTASEPHLTQRAYDYEAETIHNTHTNIANPLELKKQRSTSKLARQFSFSNLTHRRKSSGSKRRTSSGLRKGSFPNSTEKIYEDPVDRVMVPSEEEETKGPAPPSIARRNPFARAHATKNSTTSSSRSRFAGKLYDSIEIQRNPPTQSRNPDYVSNSFQPKIENHTPATNYGHSEESNNVKHRDGVEIRSDDIRAATTKRWKDRSAKLPSPTAVTDNPGRPIVSFRPDWQPSETDLVAPQGLKSTYSEGRMPANATTTEPKKSNSSPAVPTIGRLEQAQNHASPSGMPQLEQLHLSQDSERARSSPVISQISVSNEDIAPKSMAAPTQRAIPTINVPDIPSISVDAAPSQTSSGSRKSKQEPHKKNTSRPTAIHSASAPPSTVSQWTPSRRGATALCAQCALPISGKIVTAAGTRFHPNCFTCFHCGEHLECVDFYPEPVEQRNARLERIQRRNNSEEIDDGPTDAQDFEDDSLRFYCHLDFHELFSPRCKSCKTPIEGEVIVACGAEWHVGHFFCAQCGDPFDQTTPFVEKDGYAWCVNCHTNRYSARCKKCKHPVTNMVVQALGAEWHQDCFCCIECNGEFVDGTFFLRGDSQNPVCSACEQRRLKA